MGSVLITFLPVGTRVLERRQVPWKEKGGPQASGRDRLHRSEGSPSRAGGSVGALGAAAQQKTLSSGCRGAVRHVPWVSGKTG